MEQHETPAPSKLTALAGYGQWVVAGSAIVVLGYGLYLLLVPAEALFLMLRDVPPLQTLPSSWVVGVAMAVAAVPVLAFLSALFQAWRFFGEVKHGRHYGLTAQRSLKWLGRAALGCAATGVLARTLLGLLLSSANPPGQKMLVIGISSGDVGSVVVALLVFVFANVMREAAALARENASFV